MPENEYLRVRNAFDDARVRLAAARQKLSALGLTEKQMDDLPEQPVESLRRQELRAPISGKVAERRVDLGALVGREGQESELYVIADLSEVWADLAISARRSRRRSRGTGDQHCCRFHRSAHVSHHQVRQSHVGQGHARCPRHRRGSQSHWHVASRLIHYRRHIPEIPIPRMSWSPRWRFSALTVTLWCSFALSGGFHKRVVRTAREDEQNVEIISGLAAGEQIAVSNTFTLKAELGKAAADHDD